MSAVLQGSERLQMGWLSWISEKPHKKLASEWVNGYHRAVGEEGSKLHGRLPRFWTPAYSSVKSFLCGEQSRVKQQRGLRFVTITDIALLGNMELEKEGLLSNTAQLLNAVSAPWNMEYCLMILWPSEVKAHLCHSLAIYLFQFTIMLKALKSRNKRKTHKTVYIPTCKCSDVTMLSLLIKY